MSISLNWFMIVALADFSVIGVEHSDFITEVAQK
jgi:hypothetical protein